jgi:type IV secretory pathway TraG/TraD family ATPase VirD4
MIGSFIVSSIQVETMKRANLSMNERKDFTMYIDEFQNFATESFAVILSEARKYKLSLVVANQYISQVQDEIQNAIFGNV